MPSITIELDALDACGNCPIAKYWTTGMDAGYRCDLFDIAYLPEFEDPNTTSETGTSPLKCNKCRKLLRLPTIRGRDGI